MVVVALLLIISLCLILVLVRMRKRRGDYLVKKEKSIADGTLDRAGKEADMELRQPLNNHHTNLGASSCSSRSSPDPKSPSYGPHTATLRRVIHPPTVPNDHLAKLDEFSMISVALGPRGNRGIYMIKKVLLNGKKKLNCSLLYLYKHMDKNKLQLAPFIFNPKNND